MSHNGRLAITFVFTLILYFAIGEINNLIGGWSVYLHVDALLIVFYGLFLTRFGGLLITVLLAFLAESLHPVPLGTCFLGYLGIWSFFVWAQPRIRRQNPAHLRFITVSAQALWMLGMALFLGPGHFLEGMYWQRWAIDLAASLGIIFLTVQPWCRFQLGLLHSLGWNLEAQASTY